MANLIDARARLTRITLNDGVEREIKYTLNAMAELEDRYGSVEECFAKADEGSIKAVRCILWAGLLHADENLTEKQVGNLIDIQCMENIMKSITDAMTNDMPENEESLPNAVTPAI